MSKNPILIDEEEDNENSAPTTSVFEQPNEPPRLLRSRPFEWEKNAPDYVYRKLFEWFLLSCMRFTKNIQIKIIILSLYFPKTSQTCVRQKEF